MRGRWPIRVAALCLIAGIGAQAAAQSAAPPPLPRPPELSGPPPAPADIAAAPPPADQAALAGSSGETPVPPLSEDAGPAPASEPLRIAPAGTTGPVGGMMQAVLTVDQEALYRQSRWGRRAAQQIAEESRKVAADNDTAFAALVADEDALTAARATLGPEEFRRRATAFDQRVTAVRQEREEARNALAAMAERDRALFFQAAAPVMGRVMQARGALVVLDQRTVLISDERTDVTAATIAALDAALGDGSAIVAAAEAAAAEKAPAEDTKPAPAPEAAP